jgi:hypothetical protein
MKDKKGRKEGNSGTAWMKLGDRKSNGSCQRLWGEENWELFNGSRVSVLQDEKVLKIGCITM